MRPPAAASGIERAREIALEETQETRAVGIDELVRHEGAAPKIDGSTSSGRKCRAMMLRRAISIAVLITFRRID